MDNHQKLHQDTRAVHAGIGTYDHLPVIPPIFQVSTFLFDSAERGADLFAGRAEGYIYSRMRNPTVKALEDAIANLEGGTDALACGSGMAAVHTAISALAEAGDHIVCSDAVYGPTCTLVEKLLPKWGIESTVVDTSDLDAIKAAIRPNTKVVYLETPGNPTLVITDLKAVSDIAHKHGAKVVVDNTFMSPILQKPFQFGADVVVHSLTKFINGHADVVGGAIVVNDDDLYKTMRVTLNHFGGVLPPFESFLVHRGLKTLPIRMQRHCQSASFVANWLEKHPSIERVDFPGLPSHPQYEIAQRQMTGPGGVISFELKGGLHTGSAMMNSVKLCGLAVSLGGVETLIQHPASMTHASMGRDARLRARISDGLVRISVGIEEPDDIIADLEQAIEKAEQSIPHESGHVAV